MEEKQWNVANRDYGGFGGFGGWRFLGSFSGGVGWMEGGGGYGSCSGAPPTVSTMSTTLLWLQTVLQMVSTLFVDSSHGKACFTWGWYFPLWFTNSWYTSLCVSRLVLPSTSFLATWLLVPCVLPMSLLLLCPFRIVSHSKLSHWLVSPFSPSAQTPQFSNFRETFREVETRSN